MQRHRIGRAAGRDLDKKHGDVQRDEGYHRRSDTSGPWREERAALLLSCLALKSIDRLFTGTGEGKRRWLLAAGEALRDILADQGVDGDLAQPLQPRAARSNFPGGHFAGRDPEIFRIFLKSAQFGLQERAKRAGSAGEGEQKHQSGKKRRFVNRRGEQA